MTLSRRNIVFAVLAILSAQATVLLILGRVPICQCGTVKLWHGDVLSSENSQHILDWYSFTHIIHGFGFYLLGRLLLPNTAVTTRLLLAILLEASWEIVENTSFVIERYRAATISLNYYGDSVVNSVSDALMALLGFVLAYRLPVIATIALALAIEVMLAFWIRDNLTLNIIMLVHPFDAIQGWQAAPPAR